MPKYEILVTETIVHLYEFETDETDIGKVENEFYDVDPIEYEKMHVSSDSRDWSIYRTDKLNEEKAHG